VNIGPVTSEFKKGVFGIFATTRLQFDDRPTFGTFWHSEMNYNFD